MTYHARRRDYYLDKLSPLRRDFTIWLAILSLALVAAAWALS